MRGLSPEETRDLIVSVGTHRTDRRLLPYQVASFINKAQKSGESVDSISDQINISKSVIRSFLTLLKLPEKVQSMIGWGSEATSIAFSTAVEIARLDTPLEMEILAQNVLELGLSLKDATQVVQIYKRSNGSINDAIKTVLDLQVEYEKRHLIIGEILSTETIHYLSNLNNEQRNLFFKNSLIKNGLGPPTYGHKIQGKFFIIVVDEQYYKKVISLGEGLEEKFTIILQNAVDKLN
jgi:hypothetical protein